jgi:hypothetical protein
MAGLVDNPEYWRARAEETRTLAESLNDKEARKIMLGIAKDYDRMADRAESGRQKNEQSKR